MYSSFKLELRLEQDPTKLSCDILSAASNSLSAFKKNFEIYFKYPKNLEFITKYYSPYVPFHVYTLNPPHLAHFPVHQTENHHKQSQLASELSLTQPFVQ